MTDQQQQSITPPPELVQQWVTEWAAKDETTGPYVEHVAEQAARWGADQELEACVNYFHEYDTSWGEDSELVTGLRAARRPKLPSLKDQALTVLDDLREIDATHYNILRNALEQLND